MKKINFIFKTLFLTSVLFLVSCSDDDNVPDEPKGDYEKGILISGEGSGAGSGSVTFISNDYTTKQGKIYNKVNGADLGTFLQSMTLEGDNAYIIVDNQNTISIVNRYSFQELGKVTEGLSKPRYIVVVGNRGYVTNWGSTSDETDDFIAVVDINTFEFIEKIAVGNGPERIAFKNGKLYVTHKGAFTNNNIVSVINLTNNEVSTITVKDRPDEMFFKSNNELVVLSEGRTLYDSNFNVIGHTQAGIATINLQTNVVTSEIEFSEGVHPSLMDIENGQLYYAISNDVYKVAINTTSPATSKLLTAVDGYFYGMSVKNGKLYALDASFSDISKVNIFDLSSNEKTNTFDAPLGASKIYFN
ncbi:YncE family protein [Tenacibaculum sp. ZS6-P6]|uniref:YncE family protein n=1 Tax=Tenacibaculum sp. ZS6-P6 TaxID=3447503 RepID=UPI003F97A9A7